MMDGVLEAWDPVHDPSSPRPRRDESLTAEQRRRLFSVRDRLQRAMIAGGQFDVVERTNASDPSVVTTPYTPASAARFKVIAEDSSAAKLSESARQLASDLQLSTEIESAARSPGLPSAAVEASPGDWSASRTSVGATTAAAAAAAASDSTHSVRIASQVGSVAVPPSSAVDRPIAFASNTATSILLSRQFEALSRKDIMLEQQQEHNMILYAFFQGLNLHQYQQYRADARLLAAELEDVESERRAERAAFVRSLSELESACRRRTEQVAAECTSRIDMEVSRALSVIRGGQVENRRNWVEQQEERARNALVLECDRQLSRIMGVQMSEAQGIAVKALLRDRIPHTPLGLSLATESPAVQQADEGVVCVGAAASGADGTGLRTGDRAASPPPEQQQQQQQHYPGGGGGGDGGTEGWTASPHNVAAVPTGALLAEDADRSSTAGTTRSEDPQRRGTELLARFTPHWGWMFKSTGVLMTWQKRFFVFTQRGKLRYSVSGERGPWTTLFGAHSILRVEVDSYHDATQGVRPPSDQYHQYGLYVDIADQQTNRQHRVRLCCMTRQELNAWLTVLRNACDTVFELEQMGAIARSPHRRRLDPTLVEALMHTNTGLGRGSLSLHSYRKRTQFEDDLAALEAQHADHERAEREKSERASSPPFGGPQRSPSPPTVIHK